MQLEEKKKTKNKKQKQKRGLCHVWDLSLEIVYNRLLV